MPSSDSHWEAFGKVDPYYGVLTDPKYRKVRSDDAIRGEFFATGDAHVDRIFATLLEHLAANPTDARVLDFGCGVGRVTIPLARRSREVVGVDVSESMLMEARRNCESAGLDNVTFVQSDDDLSKVTGTFDLVHSHIVLQHIPPPRGEALFAAMLSRLREGGVGVVHFTYWVPARPARSWPRRTYSALRAALGSTRRRLAVRLGRPPPYPVMDMNAYDTNRLLWLLQENGCHRLHVRFTDHAGPRGVVLFFKKEPLPSM